ncbi:MAG: chondroitinase-B domain-containing protein [Planctomycetaceae bacterium]
MKPSRGRRRRRSFTVGLERLEPRTVLAAAPVLSGPTTAAVELAGSIAFSSPAAFSVAHAEPTASETVSIAASAGSVSVNLAATAPGARTFYVESATQFNAAVDRTGASFATLAAGDRVLLKGGAWGGIVRTLTGSMTDAEAQTNPALIIACDASYVPTAGGVVVNGVSAIDLAGTGITFCGVTFSSTSGMLKKGSYVDYDETGALAYLVRLNTGSRYMTVSDVVFDHCGWDSTDYANNDHYGAWIAVYGYHHTIRGCEMSGRDFDPNDINVADPTRRRSIREATIIIYKGTTDLQYGTHQIDHNYFGERKVPLYNDARLPVAADGRLPADLDNGWETIRCGSGDFTELDFNTTIEFNTFYHAIQSVDGGAGDQTGEPEMVSIKSRHNVFRGNTILNNYGEVCIRQGDYNVVSGNVFLAGGAYDASGTIVLTEQRNTRMGGVRVFGFGNTVANNYFYRLNSDGIRSAVILGSGGTDPGTLSSLGNGSGTQYETANYTHVVGNTFIDCKAITLDNPNGETYPVYGTQFLNNLVTYTGSMGASGLVGNTTAGYGSLLLAAHGGRASGNLVYSATSSQLGSAKALLGDTWLNETFEAYATAATPSSSTSPLLVSAGYTTVAAGNGGKMARYQKTTTSGGGALQYSLSASNATARPQGFLSFDIQQNANASVAATNELFFRVGVNDTAGLSSASAAFIDLRFKQDTTSNLRVYSAGTQVGTAATVSPTSVNTVKVWYNNKSTAMNYVDPTGVDRTLAAKSFVVFVGATLVTPSASGSTLTTPSGATLDIGKIAFLTGSSGQADFSVDNVFAGDADPCGAVNTIGSTTAMNPGLTGSYDVLAVPTASSPAVGRAVGTPAVNDTSTTKAAVDLAGLVSTYAAQDVRGLARPATGRDIGCYEVEAAGTGLRPLRRGEVGVSGVPAPTVSGVVVTSGGNGTGALAFSGTLGQVNAVLATLAYAAPASGSTATLTVQARDAATTGNTVTTTVTLLPAGVVTVAAGQTVIDATPRTGTTRLVKRGAGTLVLTAAATFSGGTVVEQGEIIVRSLTGLGAGGLDVRAGGRVTFDVGAGVVSLTALALDLAGRLDLGAGGMSIAAGGLPAGGLRSLLIAGRNDGSWDGAGGIGSRAATPTSGRTIGYVVGDDGSGFVCLAAAGDTNLDGAVDVLDTANFLASGFYDAGGGGSWDVGDFNYDGIVDVLDAAEFAAAALYDTGSYLP